MFRKPPLPENCLVPERDFVHPHFRYFSHHKLYKFMQKHLLGTSASLRTFGSFMLLTKKIRYDDVRTATPVPLKAANILASITFVSFAS